MYSKTYLLTAIISLFIAGCSGQSPGPRDTFIQNDTAIDTGNPVSESLEKDSDQDGFSDSEDNWPNDPSKPIVSILWGKNGENWDQNPGLSGIQSRLPFYGLAGYRDGAAPPSPTCTLNVVNFGATANDTSDDTEAFWAALNQARSNASVKNRVVICIPGGVFELSKQLHLNQSGIVLRGAGRDATILNYKQGMIDQVYPEFVGNLASNWDGNKAIVLGDSGFAWQDTLDLNELSNLGQLPRQGDLSISLPRALTPQELVLLEASGHRIRLMQSSHYSHKEVEIKDPIFTAGIYGGPQVKNRVQQQIESGSFVHDYNEFTPGKCIDEACSDTKWANGHETLYQQFVVHYEPGSLIMQLDRPLRFDMTYEGWTGKRPKLQLINNSVDADIDIGVESLTLRFAATEWGSCAGSLPDYPCTESSARHSGYWAQGGIEIQSDFSWVRDVRFINSDNPLNIRGDFNTSLALTLEANRISPEGVSATQSPNDPESYIRVSSTGHVGIGLHGIDNLVDNVIMKTNFVHSLSMYNSQGNVYSNVRAVQPENNPTDSWGRETVKINLDHHRQIIHATLWTEIQLGGSYRMWDSTGGITEGFNAAALNTYWGINSSSPTIDHWPHNRKGAVEWGYHYINIVGTNIQQKPPAPQHHDISEQPYPYLFKNEEPNPFPYHPDNAHLEPIDPQVIWPQNLYYAQRHAYLACKLTIKPISCESH